MPSEAYLLRAGLWLTITTLLYFLMNGAQLFETVVLVPKWTAAPPDSLQLFRGRYGLDFKWFWIVLHSVHELTFLLALAYCWQLRDIRYALLGLLLAHFTVRAWTLGYFAPAIMEFQRLAGGGAGAGELAARTARWRQLNYVRVGVFLLVSFGLLPLLTRVLQLWLGLRD
jgi:hypothetical protein